VGAGGFAAHAGTSAAPINNEHTRRRGSSNGIGLRTHGRGPRPTDLRTKDVAGTARSKTVSLDCFRDAVHPPAVVTTETAPPTRPRATQRPAPVRQSRAIATRTRLLEAAIDVLVRSGYAGTSTVEVCKRAKVSRGAHLHHFPTKAELLAAAVEHLFARRLAELRAELLPVGDRRRRLAAALTSMWTIYSGPTLAAWMELVIAARTDAALRRAVAAVERSFFGHARAAFVELLANSGLSPTRAAALTRLLLATLDGLALHHVLVPADDPRAVLAELERMFGALAEDAR